MIFRTLCLLAVLACTTACRAPEKGDSDVTEKLDKSEADWRAQLTPEQYAVLREKGTERPFTGKYWKTTAPGIYRCAGCGQELFHSDTKFDAGCGWPSFCQPAADGRIGVQTDTSHGMTRTEV
ncbi:MAG: peptide-methionine (R)-S-oxide reductase MsrB, partial [Bacteroidales bacterium]|nr:peptide-methionine (R)-S-oxide reductase MsrB [Bacteroidales bacterium]